MCLTTAREELEEADSKNKEESWNLDIVGVYAERLSAVTHAFALCCYTLQQASGR